MEIIKLNHNEYYAIAIMSPELEQLYSWLYEHSYECIEEIFLRGDRFKFTEESDIIEFEEKYAEYITYEPDYFDIDDD